MRGTKCLPATASIMAAALTLAACGTIDSVFSSAPEVPIGRAGNVAGFLGGVVADEPQAALTGRSILSAGGNAADAAAAMGFTLAVTLPSRAGLGSSGACLAYNPSRAGPGGGAPEAILFSATAPASPGSAARPAGVPMLARGLFALQARYGERPIESLIVPAEQFARFGVPVSRALLRDLAVVAAPLAADVGARAVFFPNGSALTEGGTLLQPELGGTLAQLRLAGVGDLYQGLVARRLEEAMPAVGGGLTVADMRAALPRFVEPLKRSLGNDDVAAFLPGPEAGGVATAAASLVLAQTFGSDPGNIARAQDRAVGVAAAYRQGGVTPEALLSGDVPHGELGPLPASTTFGAIDQNGGAVMCAVSMGNLFGTGRLAQGTGILMGVSPARAPRPLLALAMLTNPAKQAFRAMAGGSGQETAPLAAAIGLLAGVAGRLPATPPEPGRANAIACSLYLPPNSGSCQWATDPRGFGLAVGSN